MTQAAKRRPRKTAQPIDWDCTINEALNAAQDLGRTRVTITPRQLIRDTHGALARVVFAELGVALC